MLLKLKVYLTMIQLYCQLLNNYDWKFNMLVVIEKVFTTNSKISKSLFCFLQSDITYFPSIVLIVIIFNTIILLGILYSIWPILSSITHKKVTGIFMQHYFQLKRTFGHYKMDVLWTHLEKTCLASLLQLNWRHQLEFHACSVRAKV